MHIVGPQERKARKLASKRAAAQRVISVAKKTEEARLSRVAADDVAAQKRWDSTELRVHRHAVVKAKYMAEQAEKAQQRRGAVGQAQNQPAEVPAGRGQQHPMPHTPLAAGAGEETEEEEELPAPAAPP